MNILITGIAGDIGLGVGKILKSLKAVKRIIGCDTHDDHPGEKIFSNWKLLPHVKEPEYEKTLSDLVVKNKISAIFLTSEPELRFFVKKNKTLINKKTFFILPNIKAIKIGFDKFKTSAFLADQNLPFPWTIEVSKGNPLEYPCILKDRYGSGNKAVFLVKNASEAKAYKKIFPKYIWQKYLLNEASEYTCGVYGSNEGEIRVIAFRRRLNSGSTFFAELVKVPEIDKICQRVAKALELKGSINIQLKICNGVPMIFEINPRFSSTVLLRHEMGFQDVVWSLQEQILDQKTCYKLAFPIGTKASRRLDQWRLWN